MKGNHAGVSQVAWSADGGFVSASGQGRTIVTWQIRAQDEHLDLKDQRLRTQEIRRLTPAINRLGGAARLRSCGEPLTRLEYQTMLAYTLGVNVSKVGFKYSQAVQHGNPIVLYTPAPAGVGWQVQALHQVKPSCRSLPAAP